MMNNTINYFRLSPAAQEALWKCFLILTERADAQAGEPEQETGNDG